MNGCLSEEQFHLFLAEQLGDGERAALAEHVETCLACQDLLERLTTDQDVRRWRQQVLHARCGRDASGNGETGLEIPLLQGHDVLIEEAGGNSRPAVPGYEILAELGRG